MNYCASSPSFQSIHSILNNVNTGFEYELAIFYFFLNSHQKSFFRENVLGRHSLGSEVLSIFNNLDTSKFTDLVDGLRDVILTTQDDTYKPSDVVLIYSEREIGLSVKFNNSCNVNISGVYFLTPGLIDELSTLQMTLTEQYVFEMTSKYGAPVNWFRKRKRSEVVDYFIDRLRDSVIQQWRTKTHQDKRKIVEMLFQLNSVVPYGILKIGKNERGRYPVDIQWNTPTEPSIIDIHLVKYENSIIQFKMNGKLLGQLQVKFNNGFLEKAKGSAYDFLIETNKVKYGSPFSSWNFTI